jgi:hypothetical protein
MAGNLYGYSIRDKYTSQPYAIKIGKTSGDCIFSSLDKRIKSQSIGRIEENRIRKFELHEKLFCVGIDDVLSVEKQIHSSLYHFGFNINNLYKPNHQTGKDRKLTEFYRITNNEHDNIYEVLDKIFSRLNISINANLWHVCDYCDKILGENTVYTCDKCENISVHEKCIIDYSKGKRGIIKVDRRTGAFLCASCI